MQTWTAEQVLDSHRGWQARWRLDPYDRTESNEWKQGYLDCQIHLSKSTRKPAAISPTGLPYGSTTLTPSKVHVLHPLAPSVVRESPRTMMSASFATPKGDYSHRFSKFIAKLRGVIETYVGGAR